MNKFNPPLMPTVPLIDKDGNMHDSWRLTFEQLFKYLNLNMSNEGLQMPQQTTAIITNLNTANSIGKTIYDTVLHKGFINENGIFKQIVTM